MAEERARELRILEERQAQNARILAEARSWERKVIARYFSTAANPATCEHQDINVFQSMGSTQDDHEVAYGECRACLAWVVSTLQFGGGGHEETRPMTPEELKQFAKLEERRRHEEWLVEDGER